jgi:hypothetical protein
MLLRTRTTNSNWTAHARRHNHECDSHGGRGAKLALYNIVRIIMYIEITDTIAIVIALSLSSTLVITTAIKNAKLVRKVRELSVQK